MDCTRNKIKIITDYFKSLGLDVNLNTKARGHQGFFINNRIDVSKYTPDDKIIRTLFHEFAHYLHYKIKSDIKNTTINEIFQTNTDLTEELVNVTKFVDENSKFSMLLEHKNLIKKKISELDKKIKQFYPKFSRSKKFKEFDRFIRFSKAKYLLKYDRVKYISPFLRHVEYYSIENLEKDFNMPEAFSSYIRLRSYQRKQARISAKINKLKKYYFSDSELFARFIEGLCIDKEKIKSIAPNAYRLFLNVINTGNFSELNYIFKVLEQI